MHTTEAELALRIVQGVDVMLGYWDKDLRSRFANEAYRRWFGKTSQEMLGISMADFLGPALFQLNLPHIHGALAGEIQHFRRSLKRPDGAIRELLVTYVPDMPEGVVQGFSVHIVDVTAAAVIAALAR